MLVLLIRTTILYVIVVAALRVMGKRQIGELQPSELVTTILISNIVCLPIENPDLPILSGILPIALIISYEIFYSYIALKSNYFRKLIIGSPIIIIRDGELIQSELKKLRMTVEDVMEELRQKDVFKLEDVHYAIVETNGKLSILKKFSTEAVNNKDMQISGVDDSPPFILISDGRVLKHALDEVGVTMDFILGKLKNSNADIKDVFLMTCDNHKNIHIIKRNMVSQ